jgi:Coenzyme PQQ synthesis protein D (PqqD)
MSRLYVARNLKVAARNLGGEMMIMSGRDSTLFTLNKTATIIWQAADGSTTLQEIVEHRICPEFEVEPNQALQDAETLARELASHDILQVSENPIPSQNSATVESRKEAR